MSTYYVPVFLLCPTFIIMSFVLTALLQSRYCHYTHFIGEEIEVHKDQVICPKLLSILGLKPTQSEL